MNPVEDMEESAESVEAVISETMENVISESANSL